MTLSLQETYTPGSACFGCGPAIEHGLQLASFADGDELVAEWQPAARYEAIHGFINGDGVATLLDCHRSWTAARHLDRRLDTEQLPRAVTAQLSMRYLWPTPVDEKLVLRARVVTASDHKAVAEDEASNAGGVLVTSRGVFVVAGEFAPKDRSSGRNGCV
jgi:acyl-coenzyme A thioesterase PaaI-like protein